ncbi:GNAT family N-acetyltransferase [Myceligenerans pegani]|nr:GNAT family N-acetyltransferase [Myceligenerans sp. TRM 65318]
MSEAVLRTARMALRPVREDDVDRLCLLNSEPGVMRYLDRRPPSRDAVEAEVAELLRHRARHAGFGRFVAEDDGGTFLGWFGLLSDGAGVPELGYRLRRGAWGKGLATEGGRALVDHAFELGVERVVAEAMAVNAGSRRVLEKCGLRHVETFHVPFDDPLPGTEHGEVRYEITRTDWLRSRGADGVVLPGA